MINLSLLLQGSNEAAASYKCGAPGRIMGVTLGFATWAAASAAPTIQFGYVYLGLNRALDTLQPLTSQEVLAFLPVPDVQNDTATRNYPSQNQTQAFIPIDSYPIRVGDVLILDCSDVIGSSYFSAVIQIAR